MSDIVKLPDFGEVDGEKYGNVDGEKKSFFFVAE